MHLKSDHYYCYNDNTVTFWTMKDIIELNADCIYSNAEIISASEVYDYEKYLYNKNKQCTH